MDSELLLFNLSGLPPRLVSKLENEVFLLEESLQWSHITVSLSQFCAHVYCAHNFVLKKKRKNVCIYIKKNCKI